ncbi:MAG: hypothetical protein E4G99_01165 [Anaerolineales bacterium]|nr:MAG: hypothetical protein E4G99_01165 [Anaerolineales bacterium]
MNNALDELLSLAERTYVRMEAEQLIQDCTERGDPQPFNELLEELVFAGSTSLMLMREILDVIRVLKVGLSKEGLGVRQDLMDAMAEFGIQVPDLLVADAPEAFRRICSQELRRQVNDMARNLENEDSSLLEEICIEAGGRVTTIAGRMAILRQMEASVLDWLSGLAYEAAHKETPEVWFREGSYYRH